MKYILQYMILVLFVGLGLATVIFFGNQLEAPPDIHGVWLLETNNISECTTLAQLDSPNTMQLSQSGQFLDISLGTSDEIRFSARFKEGQIDSPKDNSIHLVLDRQSTPYRLTGSLILPGCEAGIPVSYILQPAEKSSIEGLHP